jgi:hypothetical protein
MMGWNKNKKKKIKMALKISVFKQKSFFYFFSTPSDSTLNSVYLTRSLFTPELRWENFRSLLKSNGYLLFASKANSENIFSSVTEDFYFFDQRFFFTKAQSRDSFRYPLYCRFFLSLIQNILKISQVLQVGKPEFRLRCEKLGLLAQ